jgi:hypothetical protein
MIGVTMKIRNALLIAASAGLAVSGTASAQYGLVSSIPGTFTDISATGAVIISEGDDMSVPFVSGVTNALVTSPNLYASTNGNVTDAEFWFYFNELLPMPEVTFGLFPFWDDLYVDAPGSILHQTVVENGVNVEIIQWNQVRTYAAGPGSARGTFQIKIFASGPTPVQYIYQDVTYAGTFSGNGASATVGLQTPTSMEMYSFDTPLINNGLVLSVVPATAGACCLPDLTCTATSQNTCTLLGGTYSGNNTTCATANCPTPGACCLEDGSCTQATPEDCSAFGGVYNGNSTSCASTNCPQPGACCLNLGMCQFVQESRCLTMGGVFRGAGVTCATAACPAPPGTISTMFAANNGGDPGGAVYFDLSVGPSPITISALNTNTDTSGNFGMTVYTVAGGYAGNLGSSGPWTLQSTGEGTGAGYDQPSNVVLHAPFVLSANTTYGVALVMDPNAAHVYTNGDGTNQQHANADLSLSFGAASNAPFNGIIFEPRVWNGTVYYALGGTAPSTGACCRPNGSCVVTTSAYCTTIGGTYRGNSTICATANCPLPPGTWVEENDAGELPASAQVTRGPSTSTALNEIRGAIGSGDVDMYKIRICNPGSFSATTVGGAGWDTMLWLFDLSGNGVTGDDDTESSLQSALGPSTITASGEYLLAISRYYNPPVDAGTTVMFEWGDPEWTLVAGVGPIAGWNGNAAAGGNYSLFLTGSCFDEGSGGCYANCDASTTAPVLNVQDFTCFLQRYAAGDSYANCDNSTVAPVLNVQDFTCFLQRYAAGCP